MSWTKSIQKHYWDISSRRSCDWALGAFKDYFQDRYVDVMIGKETNVAKPANLSTQGIAGFYHTTATNGNKKDRPVSIWKEIARAIQLLSYG